MPAVPFYNLGGGLLKHVTQSSASGGGSDDVSLVVIKKQEISDSSSITFIDGSDDVVFDSTYKSYMFALESIRIPADGSGNNQQMEINMGATTDGTNFNVALTQATIAAYQYANEATGNSEFYGVQSQTTMTWFLAATTSAPAFAHFWINDPASSMRKGAYLDSFFAADDTPDGKVAVYRRNTAVWLNTTSPVTGIQFSPASGAITSGDITLYGLKTTS
jgi:hypothetical protein